jgi:hypothetical protein
MSLQGTFARRPSNALLAALIGGGTLAACMSGLAEGVLARALIFYAGTATAYAVMPYVRRGDIPLAAMWVVLAAEFAPLASGRMISPASVIADVVGIALAAAPIYIARLRQVAQGDTRSLHRREKDRVF